MRRPVDLAVTAARPVASHWWKLVAVGSGVFAATIIAVNINGEVPEGWWVPMMITFLAAVMTVATGLILSVAHLAARRSGRAGP